MLQCSKGDIVYIQRSITPTIYDLLRDFKIVSISGPRQSGKTTLAKEIADNLGMTYYTFDDDVTKTAAESDPVNFIKRLSLSPCVIDEIQMVPEVVGAMKRVVDERDQNGMFLLTGSADLFKISTIKESLAGRMVSISLYPLSFFEISANSANMVDMLFENTLVTYKYYAIVYQTIVENILSGGYPPILGKSEKSRDVWFESYIEARIEKERKLLRNMANGKAKVIASISKTAKEQNRQLNNYRKQQVKSTLYLQDLRQTLLESQNKLLNQDTATNRLNMTKKVLDFPLKIDRQITANFKDKKYKKTFGVDHLGVDFFAPQGTIFYAPADGKIVKTGIHGYGYSYVVVAHANNLSTVYGHISRVFLNVGQTVKAGEAIGKTGGTPGTKGAGYFTTGPHLHFEVWKNRNVVNPLEYLKE
jgi:murein DD-endopeptidase MepM/ murein hydrolase activator NlpD